VDICPASNPVLTLVGPTDPPEYPWLYSIPAVVFGGGFLAAASTGAAGLVQAGYLVSSVLCIGSISGLASQATARLGNMLGILGVGTGVLASLLAAGFSPEVLTQFGALATLGTLAGRNIEINVLSNADGSRVPHWKANHPNRPSSDSGRAALRRWSGCCAD
jgi:hypothetical protein